MKYISFTSIFVCTLLLALSGCKSDDADTNVSGQEVRLSFSVDDNVQAASSAVSATVKDCYSNDNLDKVAIILKQTGTDNEDAPGAPSYNYAPAQWKKTDEKWGPIDTDLKNVLLWKTGSALDPHEVVRFVAYAPATTDKVTTSGDYSSFSIMEDQTTDANRLASDLVLYEEVVGRDGKIIVTPSSAINLEHKMCRLAVTLTARNEFGRSGVKIKKVSVQGVRPQADGGGGLTAISSSQQEDIVADKSAFRSFIIGPGEQKLILRIEATDLSASSDKDRVYTLSLENKTFVSANQYNLQVYIGKDKVELSLAGVTITPWNQWTPTNPGDDHLETD